MDVRTKIREAMAAADGVRTAADMPMPPQNDGVEQGQRPSMAPVAQPGARQIPKNHAFDPKALKPLARMLWSMSVSMGHALQAYRTLNRVKSSTVSPDGMLGGRGYVMKVTEMRQSLYAACEALSMISDTIHDEINAPHWKPKIAELDQSEMDAIDRLIGESEEMLDNPEEEVEEGEEEVEKKGKPSPNWPPKSWDKERSKKEKDTPSSELPGGGDPEVVQRPSAKPKRQKEASVDLAYDRRQNFRSLVAAAMANSTIPTQTLPGPRVQHLDRADTDQMGPGGSVNPPETVPPGDAWGFDGGYPSTWETDESTSGLASSGLPADSTPTQGLDFGVGSLDPARGEGLAGNEPVSPSQGAKGVYGPAAELPSDPGGKTKDPGPADTRPMVQNHFTDRAKRALERLRPAVSEVPNDNNEGPARADYFDGPKPDNDMNTVRGDSELPGDGTNPREEFDKDVMDTGYRYERPGLPRAEWDNTKR